MSDQREAHKLAPILWGMCEGGGADKGADIYAEDYQADDGDVYVRRAGELLIEQAAEISELVRYIDLLSSQLAKAAPAAPVQTAEPKRIPDMLTVETIQGAIAFGRMGINPPPSTDHWGNEFWQIGRQLAKLSETSAWDNVTPVDVAAPVQADQAQAEQAAAVRAAYENAAQACEAWGNAKVAKWADYPEMSEDAKARAWDALQCAAAIRALAAPSTATSNDGGDRE